MVGDQVNRASGTPYYRQLGDVLEKRITDGVYRAGERLPSESDLCRDFDLSRATVRETLRYLQDRGRIRLVPRRGAFVAEAQQPGWMLQFPEGFFENEAVFYQRRVETDVLSVTMGPLPAESAGILGVAEGHHGVILERLRRLDGRIALYAVNHLLPQAAALIGNGDPLRGSGSLNQTLRTGGWVIAGARRWIEAVAATRKLSGLLDVRVGHPLLLIRSVSWDESERPFDYYTSYVRSDVVKVEIAAHSLRR